MHLRRIIFFLAALTSAAGAEPLAPTVQFSGSLDRDGVPYSGPVDLRLSLCTDASAEDLCPRVESHPNVAAVAGRFSVALGAGDDAPSLKSLAAQDQQLWVKVEVSEPGAAVYTTLTPRQRLRAVPQAIWSLRADRAGYADQAARAGTLDDIRPLPVAFGCWRTGDGGAIRAHNLAYAGGGDTRLVVTPAGDLRAFSPAHHVVVATAASDNGSAAHVGFQFGWSSDVEDPEPERFLRFDYFSPHGSPGRTELCFVIYDMRTREERAAAAQP